MRVLSARNVFASIARSSRRRAFPFAVLALLVAFLVLPARADNIVTFHVAATGMCTTVTCASQISISGTFTLDLTTGTVTGGTMSMSDSADLASSPLSIPFNSQFAFPPNQTILFRQIGAAGNASTVLLIFPFNSFPSTYSGGPFCTVTTQPTGCGVISGAAIGPTDASPSLFATSHGQGTNGEIISGVVSSAASGHPVPLLNSLAPTATAPGGPAFTLNVTGAQFLSTAVVNWNGSPRTTTFVDADHLTAAITAADVANAGTAAITVTNPGGGTSNAQYFQVTNPLTATNFTTFANNEIDAYRVRPSNTLVGDFNGDGKPDLVAYGNGIIYFLPNNGDGTFTEGNWVASLGPPQPTISSNGTILSTADLNGDGIPDLILSNANGIFVAAGKRDGTFLLLSSSLPPPLQGAGPATFVTGDFNGDGFLDLAYIVPGGMPPSPPISEIQVQLGNGDGTFRAGPSTPVPANPVPGSSLTTPNILNMLAVGDFNGDSKLDLLLSVTSNDCIAGRFAVFEFLGNGDGSFATPPSEVPGTETCGKEGVTSAVVADFNGDGKQDVAYFTSIPGSFGDQMLLNVSLGNGDGTFGGAPFRVLDNCVTAAQCFRGGPVLAADLNGDGKLDLVTGNQLFYGNGDGSFAAQGAQDNGQQVVGTGDFNGDGRVDLLALGSDNNFQMFNIRELLQVPAPADFGGGITPGTQTAVPGGSATYNGSVIALNGFTGSVALTASNLPSGVTASFNPTTVAGGSGTYTLTLTVGSGVALGTYNITVTGTSGSLVHSGAVALIVNSSVGDFSASMASGSDSMQNINAGQTATYTVQITPIGGFTGNVALSVSGVPAGTTATFNPAVVTGGSGTSTLTVVTSASTPTSVYTLSITATSGPLVHTGPVFLGVGNGDFTGVITPGQHTVPNSRTITAGQSTTYNVSITYLNGFTPPPLQALTLSVSGLPPGAQFAETAAIHNSTSENDTITVSAPPGTPTGTYPLLITASGGGRIRSGITTLIIN